MNLTLRLKHALDKFNLDMECELANAGLTALFGPSGSGKSITVKMIAGLITPEAGEILLNGQTFFSKQDRINIPAHKRRIGYVSQDARLFPHLSVGKNLMYGAKRAPNPPSRNYQQHVIKLLDIAHLLDRFPANLSGGEKQRVAIGRALLSDPHILLLDEPMAALDYRRKNEMMHLIEAIRDEGRTPIILVSHSIAEITRLADNLVLVDQGRIAAQGAVDEIMSRLDLFPLTGRFEAGSVLEARLIEHDHNHGMSQVEFGNNRLWLTSIDATIGAQVRVRVRARDVILAKEQPQDLSANNILPVQIIDWRKDDKMFVDIRLACEDAHILARITQRSWNRMALKSGAHLYAIIKSLSLERSAAKR